MFAGKGASQQWMVGFLAAVLMVVGYGARGANAAVVAVGPEAFGAGAVIEDFEGIVGVSLPVTEPEWWPIGADVPVPYDFGSGFSLTGSNPTEEAQVLDFALDPYGGIYGWGLGNEGGTINSTTSIPSGTSILVHDTYVDEGAAPPLELTFDNLVARVGLYAEASIFVDIGEYGRITLEAFDDEGVSLGLVDAFADGAGDDWSVYPPGDLGPLDTWIGLETAGAQPLIRSVEIVGTYLAMDDLHFEVPEPTTLSLLALGGLALVRRR